MYRKCRFIHRSVGEPAEGSLTRIHVINQWEFVFTSPFCKLEWIGTSRGKLMWTSSGVGLPGISVREKSQTNNCIFYARHQFLSITLIFTSWSEVVERETNYKTIFTTFLLVDFLSVIVLRKQCSRTFNYLNVKKIQLLAMDILVLATMKNAAKCDT